MSVKLKTPSNGSVTLAPEDTASDVTLTVPAGTATILTTATPGVPVNGPAFSAYQSSAQSVSNNTGTKVQLQTEEFDTNSCFDNTTNYRFTPTLAGYYQLNGSTTTGASLAFNFTAIYKNGLEYKRGTQSGSGGILQNVVSAIVYLNGSTDYVELFMFQASGSSQTLQADIFATYFNGAMIRSAT
jgi:hypothetical protein